MLTIRQECVNDRVIQQAITQCLQPIIDPGFSEHSHGFRPNRSAHHAVKTVQEGIKQGYDYAVDHDLLMNRVSKWVDNKRVLALIEKYLRARVSTNGKIESTPCGIPQGGPLSPVLASNLRINGNRYFPYKAHI